MRTYVEDPMERMQSTIDGLIDRYVDEHTCMECGKRVDYELLVVHPMGLGPAVCVECLGFDPFEPTTQPAPAPNASEE